MAQLNPTDEELESEYNTKKSDWAKGAIKLDIKNFEDSKNKHDILNTTYFYQNPENKEIKDERFEQLKKNKNNYYFVTDYLFEIKGTFSVNPTPKDDGSYDINGYDKPTCVYKNNKFSDLTSTSVFGNNNELVIDAKNETEFDKAIDPNKFKYDMLVKISPGGCGIVRLYKLGIINIFDKDNKLVIYDGGSSLYDKTKTKKKEEQKIITDRFDALKELYGENMINLVEDDDFPKEISEDLKKVIIELQATINKAISVNNYRRNLLELHYWFSEENAKHFLTVDPGRLFGSIFGEIDDAVKQKHASNPTPSISKNLENGHATEAKKRGGSNKIQKYLRKLREQYYRQIGRKIRTRKNTSNRKRKNKTRSK
jgi:hypothetical protein